VRVGALLLAVLAVVSDGRAASDQVDLVARIESLTSASRDAGYATRKRLLEGFRADVEGRPGRLQGRVTSVTTFRLDDVGVDGTPRGRAAIRWEHGGLVLPSDPWEVGRDRLATHFGGRSEGTMVVVRSGSTVLYALVAVPGMVDGVRTGQRVVATVEVVGLFESTYFGLLLELDTAGSALLCPSGHVFGLDTGYRYCPYDGAPLTMVDSTDPSG
jgi:hypothetical protein